VLSFLFVCTGNICRSPLADAFMTDRSRRLLGGVVQVRSAGIAAGRYLSPETAETVRDRGLDPEALHPTQLTTEMLREADLIVTMTGDHSAEVLAIAPEVSEKTFTLKELSDLLTALPPAEPSTERRQVLARIAEAHRARSSAPTSSLPRDVRDPLGEIDRGVDDLVRGLFGVHDRAGASPGGS
jgi:protein-tyrosine phosphatase